MGTKWNVFRSSLILKLFLFIMLIMSIGVSFQSLAAAGDFRYGIMSAETETQIVDTQAAQVNSLFSRLASLGSDSDIQSGAWIDSDSLRYERREQRYWLEDQLQTACRQYNLSYADYLKYYAKEGDSIIIEEPETILPQAAHGVEASPTSVDSSIAFSYVNPPRRVYIEEMETYGVPLLSDYDLARLNAEIAALYTEYEEHLESITTRMIEERLAQKSYTLQELRNYEGLRYAIEGESLMNSSGLVYTWEYSANTGTSPVRFKAGFTQTYYDHMVEEFRVRHAHGLTGLYMLFGGCTAALAFTILLMACAGYRKGVSGIALGWWDRLYLDLNLLLSGTVFFATAYATLEMMYYQRGELEKAEPGILLIVKLLLAFAAALAITYGFTSFAKRFKRHEVLRYTLVYAVLAWVMRLLKKIWYGVGGLISAGPTAIGPLALLGAYGLITLIMGTQLNYDGVYFLFFLIFSAAVGVLIIWRINAFARLRKGVALIRTGELSLKLPETGGAVLSSLAADINGMSEGLSRAVENEVRSERMKTQLITNVSHDLKTPLTSIISYVDLLSTTEPDEEKQKEYIDVIKRKSEQLKRLVEDLFEVSKAQSGAIAVTMETLCLNELVMQAVGEWEEKLAGFSMRFHLPEDKIMIRADGTKMWRVLSNLLHNIAKYAQEGSRVYIDLARENDFAQLTFKNISNYEMNFEPEQITERFRRGDDARSGEGSGLGLSIAESFVDLQGGKMEITVDGDLFKVTLKLPLA